MEPLIYDAVVAGLGGMGSAALAHCARTGRRVLGVEQFEQLHALGSSTGKTRIIRQAYFEDAAYVPLLLRAYELWRELEELTGEHVMRLTGLLMAGKPQSEVISGSMHAARAYDLPVEYWDAAQIRARFPQLLPRGDEVGVYEREGGVVFPERAIRAHLALAARRGAQMRFGTSLVRWNGEDEGVSLELSGGEVVRTRALILTLGPWFGAAMREAGMPLEIQRNVQAWFAPSTAAYGADVFPAFLVERDSLPAPLYGFPDFGDGVKAAFHGLGETTDPDRLDREIDPERDVEPIARALEDWMPGAAATYREGKACMYSLTPDRNFVIDRHPADARVVLCGGFSGHGFKFACVAGEIAAHLALHGRTPHEIGFLSAARLRA